ncbi:MAG TPA: hypothetical protein VGG98_08120 [Solirubrobacteraceae bacterium]|jgi:hypothetical protein
MQRLKILGLALVAVFALSAVASVATASAEVKILPEVAEKYTGESGEGTLSSLSGTTVTCKKDTSEGEFEAKKPLGLFHITFKECTGPFNATCTGLGEASGVILVLGTAHLVFDKLGAKLSEAGVGVLFLLEPVHFTCLGILIKVKGEVLCLIKPVNVKAKHFEIVCEQKSAGDPAETVYWNEAGTEVKMGENGLLTEENDEKPTMSSEKTTALILTTKEIEIMT